MFSFLFGLVKFGELAAGNFTVRPRYVSMSYRCKPFSPREMPVGPERTTSMMQPSSKA